MDHTNDSNRIKESSGKVQKHVHAGKPKKGANSQTYDFKSERYLKINKKGVDHHIDYYE